MLNMPFTEGGAARLLWRRKVQVWSPRLECNARRVRVSTQLGGLTHPHLRAAHPQNSSNTPRCPSVVLWTPCSGVEWRVLEPAVNGCGEAARRASSLRTWGLRARRSPCPSCPTTHLPCVSRPSAVDHLDRDMLQRLTCSRTATVVCRVCTSGAMRAERGWVTAVNGAQQWIWFGRQPP
jgi:hypothetical protein